MRRLAPAAAAAALIALLLAGCTAGGGSSLEASSSDGLAPAAPEFAEGGEDAASDGVSGIDDSAADRSVITTGWISITVDDPIASAEQVAGLAEGAGGRVDERKETPGTDSQSASATLTVRIPADELDEVVSELRDLGTVNSVSMNASDVTEQRKDLDARIDALSASVDRLQELLGTATTIADLIAIESELTTRQAELDSLTQQRDWLVDQVDLSTLTVALVTDEAAPEAAPGDFWSGLVAGWGALMAFASWVGVAVGVLLPWLFAALLVAGIVITIVVLSSRGRRPKNPEPAASTAPPTSSGTTPEA